MRKILIIEDYLYMRENLEELLCISNFEVITASNGLQGIEQVQAHMPDLILCDIAMPVRNGYQVLETIKSDERTKDIPFVFITASADQKEIDKGKLAGADGYLPKPFNREDLLTVINGFFTSKQ